MRAISSRIRFGFLIWRLTSARVLLLLLRANWAFTSGLLRDGLSSTVCFPESIFDICKRVGRKCILTEKHKMAVANFINANPSTFVVEMAQHLLNQFNDLKYSCSTVYNFMKSECNLSLKEIDHYVQEQMLSINYILWIISWCVIKYCRLQMPWINIVGVVIISYKHDNSGLCTKYTLIILRQRA